MSDSGREAACIEQIGCAKQNLVKQQLASLEINLSMADIKPFKKQTIRKQSEETPLAANTKAHASEGFLSHEKNPFGKERSGFCMGPHNDSS